VRVLLVEGDRKASRVLKRLGLAVSRALGAALVVAASILASGCAPTGAPLAEYLAATPEDAAVLAPLEAITEGARRRDVDRSLGAYADDARAANFAAVFTRPFLIQPTATPTLTRAELGAVYRKEFQESRATSIRFYDPRVERADGEATVIARERVTRVDLLWRSRRVLYTAEAVFRLRREAGGWRIVEDRHHLRGYNVF
jgi:hypothetical protein